MNNKKLLAVFSSFILLSGCGQVDPEPEEQKNELIPGISLGMTKEEVFRTYGDDYTYNYDYRDDGSKNTVEYGYSTDKPDVFDINIDTQVIFEFEDDDKLVCYGYHIGRTGDYNDSRYPYSQDELTEAYDKIYEELSEWYGSSTSDEELAEYGVLNNNTWETEEGSVWFIVGVNMWSTYTPDAYEKGVNEIDLSCSAAKESSEL